MNRAGVLLDTGPLVALLDRNDGMHETAKALIGACTPPLRTCEAVVAESCYLLSRLSPSWPAHVIGVGSAGTFDVTLAVREHWAAIEALMRKYQDVPASLADACLIRCAEVHNEPRILTFDDDFRVYRWSRTRAFQILEPD